jgi:hypothetical protein
MANIVSHPSSKETRDQEALFGCHVSTAATTVAVQIARMLIAKRYAEVASTKQQIDQFKAICQRGELNQRTMNWFRLCGL